MDGDKDFLPVNRTSFQITGSGDWQTHDVPLARSGTMIHLRVHFPAEQLQIREIEVQR